MKQTLLVITTLLLWLIQQLLIGFLLLAGLLYIPAVQNFLVDKAASSLSESLGMEVSVESVRLSFPLDLDVQGVVAREGSDTLMAVDVLRIDVPLKPLFSGQANVDEFTLLGAKINATHMVRLSDDDEEIIHPLIILDKKAKTPTAYPRPFAQISKKPL